MIPAKRVRRPNGLACIFVHAGAGYHSETNQHIHLQACHDSAKAAMAIMKAGGSAVDAVEIAVKVLEDREITNAGYGSNLAMDGVVECDAIVVDQYGRSGAAGAVAQITNPISLARLLLDHSSQQLSLRRVPPNLLVGQGATDFAYEHGMPIMPHDRLVSRTARERWLRWREDLRKAERKMKHAEALRYRVSPSPTLSEIGSELQRSSVEQEALRKQHAAALLGSLSNEAQPISPPPSDNRQGFPRMDEPSYPLHAESYGSDDQDSGRQGFTPQGSTSQGSTPQTSTPQPPAEYNYPSEPPEIDGITYFPSMEHLVDTDSGLDNIRPFDAEFDQFNPASDSDGIRDDDLRSNASTGQCPAHNEDIITDTVGAIAIDYWGNIACAASSGGISMKHRGRVGPAALVGIGAAVVPMDLSDEDATTVATVASGTGEHMGTTMAAGTCSDRIFRSVRRVKGGEYESVNEDEALRGFIEKDFMGHPSVQFSQSVGAIGVLSVKKTKEGAYLYFAHNTDSFAFASMHSDESRPVCTMSRSSGQGMIAQGGRPVKIKRRK